MTKTFRSTLELFKYLVEKKILLSAAQDLVDFNTPGVHYNFTSSVDTGKFKVDGLIFKDWASDGFTCFSNHRLYFNSENPGKIKWYKERPDGEYDAYKEIVEELFRLKIITAEQYEDYQSEGFVNQFDFKYYNVKGKIIFEVDYKFGQKENIPLFFKYLNDKFADSKLHLGDYSEPVKYCELEEYDAVEQDHRIYLLEKNRNTIKISPRFDLNMIFAKSSISIF